MAATTAKPVKSAGKIPGSTLKIIAMVCMLIDHTAAVLFDRILISRGLLDAVNASDGGASFLSTGNTAVIYYADMIMRAIGRISFPIFCFLFIEKDEFLRQILLNTNTFEKWISFYRTSGASTSQVEFFFRESRNQIALKTYR